MAFCQIKFLKLQSLTDALVLTMEAGTALEFETQVLNLIDTAKADPHINQESVLKALKELYLAGKNHPTTRGIREKYSKLQYLQYVITHFNDLNSKTMQTVLQDINVNIDLNSFIPVLSQELNRKVYDSFKKKLYAVYYDPDANDGSGKINFSSIDSSQSIQELREELWQVILKTIGEEDTNSVFFDMWSETYLSLMQYAKKMKRALEIVQDRMHNYIMIGGKVSSAWTRQLDEEVIKPLVAIYVLNNFDLVLNQLSEGLIQINYNRGFIQDNNRTADGDLLPKYSLLEQTQGERRYNDENYNTDPEKVFGKHVYAFLLQCPNGRGSFLTKEDILQLTTNIKTRIGQLVYAEKPILAINQSGIEGVKLLLELAQGTTSQPLLDALYKHLKRYDDIFREQISSLPDEEQSEYHRKFDFVNSFINEIINSEPVNHISWTGNDETYLQSSEHTSASKSKYRTALSSKLVYNLIDNPNNNSIYFANIVTAQDPNSATEVYSIAYQDWFADITGIDIDSETWETLFVSPHNAALMQKFVSVFTDAVKQNLLYKIIDEDTIKSFVNEFAKTKEFVRLTDLLVQDKGASRIRFYNQNIDPIPSATIPNEVSRFAENATELKEQIATIFGAGDSRPANANILLGKNGNTITSQNGDFTVNYPGRYVYRSDVYLPNGQIKRARSLSAEEAQAVAFNSDFLDNYITHGIFANQLACFSDKVRHALGVFNARGKVLVPTDALHVIEKSIEDLSIQEIKEVSFNQFSWYYQGVEKQLCKDLSELLGKNITNIDEYAAELEKHSLKELRDKRYKHPNLQIYDQVHWDIIKVNGEKKPIINNSLYYNIRMAHNKDLYFADIQESYNNFKKIDIQVADKFFDLSFILDNIESFRKMLSNGDVTKIPTNQEILNLFNRTLWGTESIATWNKGITGDGEAVAKCNELLEVLMLKYFYLTNLMTDADLQIVGKFSFIHPNKDFANSRHFYKDLVKGITSHGFINSELWKDLKKDASARYQNSTKRNSSIVAAAMPMVHSNPYGVAETMRIAHILNLQTALQNFIGEIKDDIDVNDGMVLSTGVQDFLEHNSYLGKNYRGTKKVLGVIPNYMGFTQIKCADFVITNAMVRDSFKSNTRDSRKDKSLNKYDMRILLMKALSASFDNTFYGSFDTLTFGDNMSDFQTKIFREINGEYLLLLEIEWHEGTQDFTFNWGGTLIEEHIESAWDLYRAFGGAYCYEQDENGEFIFSEQSQELVARFICRFNSDYKSRMIAKFADISAVKPGICNDNSTEAVLDKNVELLTQVVKTSRWGIQQDASHESDEATVPNPTQVQTAVQFNGLSIEDAEELNKTLAKVVERKLNKLKLVWGKENGNHFEYYTYLANMLYKSLSKQNYSISDAPEVVAEVLQQVMLYRKNGYRGEMPVVPFSDSSIFYKLASDILSEVNHEMIRQKMAGIPIIQNPSHGIIGIYEDRNGDIYMRSDLLELAKKSITLTEADIAKYHTDEHNLDFEEDWLIAKFLDESKLFGREIIDVKSLQIGDSVILVNTLGQEEHRYISSPMELWELETDGRKIYKDYTAQRDLRPTCITFKLADSGKLENLWFLNSTKALIRAGKNKSLLLKQWHKANLEGLGTEGEGYYFDKLEDFLDYKRGKEDRSIKVTNVNYIAGEQIISKLNRTAHDLGHKSLAWIRQNHEDHFYNVAKNRYSRVNRNDLLFTEELTAVYTNKEISIVVDEDKELYPETNIVHEPTDEQNSRYGVYLTNGELLVYSDTSDIGVSETNQNGKDIITIHVQSVEDALNIANEIKNNESPNTWNSISSDKAINGFVLNNYTHLNGSETDEEIRTILNTASNELYASFLASNRTISLRIPSQSFQSFMYNRTVGFLDGEKNDGYVNVWEIWFQGSDYDIKHYWCH